MAIDTEKRRNPSEIAPPGDTREVSAGLYRFDDVTVDVAAGRLLRRGQEVVLRLKSWEVLLALVRNRHRVVTKDELRQTVWRDVVVDDDAMVQCVVDIRKALGDDPRNPRYVRTIPKVGYRFVADAAESATGMPFVVEEVSSVEIELVEESGSERPPGVRALPSSAPPRSRGALVLALALGAAAVAGYLWTRRGSVSTALETVPGRRSVAVLLFENPSADPDLDWLREGLADMLVADLSGSGKLSVLSRQQLHVLMSAMGARPGERLSLETAVALARRSRADAFVLGSFTRLAGRVRVQAQLHDGRHGALLAAESATAERPELVFDQVDRLAGRLLTHLGVATAGARPSPGVVVARTGSLQAYSLYVKALEKAQAFHTLEALDLLKQAVALDPSFAMAHARIGYVYVFTWGKPEEGKPYLDAAYRLADKLSDVERFSIHAWHAVAQGDFESAISAMRKLVALDPRDTEAAVRLAGLLRGERRGDEAIAVLSAACEAVPEATPPWNSLAGAYAELYRHDEAIAAARHYVELAPAEANAHDTLGYVLHWAGRYEEAVASFRKALELSPRFDVAHVHLGNALFQLGRQREAIEAFREFDGVAPSASERARALDSLAIVYYRRGELDAAWAAAQERSRVGAEQVVGVDALIAWERGDRAAAERLAQIAARGGPFLSRGSRASQRGRHAIRGLLWVRQGRVDDGLAELRAALADGPLMFNVDTYEGCLAEALLLLARWDEAIAECERLLRLTPNDPFARYRLGVALHEKGDRVRARAELARFLDLWKGADPDARERVDAEKRMRSLGA